MKYFTILLFALFLLSSCKGGDITREDIFVYESGTLVSAQDYSLSLPANAGEYSLQIVSYGVLKVHSLSLNIKEITFEFDEASRRTLYDTEEFIYDGNKTGTINRYIEDIIITVPINTSDYSKKCKFRIHTAGRDGHIADITVIQNAKE